MKSRNVAVVAQFILTKSRYIHEGPFFGVSTVVFR